MSFGRSSDEREDWSSDEPVKDASGLSASGAGLWQTATEGRHIVNVPGPAAPPETGDISLTREDASSQYDDILDPTVA
ncbi:hypothetical protein [Glutamicibacter arilaitensis]|uniref:hypothetical protein n=1 Tax=Glutamicibacter arilaitensis TaxID=256701 RepID=UPI00384EEFB0